MEVKFINNRKHFLFICKNCKKESFVRQDYFNKHSEFCRSCNKINNKSAQTHGDSKKRLYHIWIGLFQRKYKINHPVCSEWHDYLNFKNWSLSNGYNDDLTIDRIDNKKGYYPENCQWITLAENARKDKIIFTPDEMIKVISDRRENGLTQVQMARILNVSRNTIQRAEKFYKENKNENKIVKYSNGIKKS